MREVLEFIARNLVDSPDEVQVTAIEAESSITLRLSVGAEDVGRVIGRQGRTARAIRGVVRAAGARSGVGVLVEIVG